MQSHHRAIPTNGITLHVQEVNPGGEKLAILLHGFPEIGRMSKDLAPTLAQLGYRVWMPDQRGYNRSDKPTGIAAYTFDTLMQDVLGLIDAAGVEQALLIGHDFGGAVAWWLANKHPERLENLVIINTPHHRVFAEYIRTRWRQKRNSWYMFFFQVPRLPEMLLGLRRGWIIARSLRRSSQPGAFSKAEMGVYQSAWMQPGALTGMLNWYRATIQHPSPRPPDWRIRVRTLLIWGKKDPFLSADMAQPSIDLCDEGALMFIEDATHWVMADQPGRVQALVRDFLG